MRTPPDDDRIRTLRAVFFGALLGALVGFEDPRWAAGVALACALGLLYCQIEDRRLRHRGARAERDLAARLDRALDRVELLCASPGGSEARQAARIVADLCAAHRGHPGLAELERDSASYPADAPLRPERFLERAALQLRRARARTRGGEAGAPPSGATRPV